MLEYKIEQELKTQGFQAVCGVDEAGRGPLCGPVVAAACILPIGLVIEGLNDSKKLTAKKREALYDFICENAISYCSPPQINENIAKLSFLSMILM